MESSISVIICIFVTILLSSLSLVLANNTVEIPLCKDAPNPTLKIVCSQLHRWDSAVRGHSSFQATWSSWSSSTTWSDSRSRWSQTSSSWTVWSAWSTYSDSEQHGQPHSRHRLEEPLQPSTRTGQLGTPSISIVSQPTSHDHMQPQMSGNTVYEQKNGDEFTQTSDIAPQPASGNAWNDGDDQIENDDNDSTWTSQHGEVVGGQQRDTFPPRRSFSSNTWPQKSHQVQKLQQFVAPDRTTTTISRTSTFSSSHTQQQQQHTSFKSVTHTGPAGRSRNSFVPQVQGPPRKFEKDLFSMNQDTVGPPGFQPASDRQRNLQRVLPPQVAGPPGLKPGEVAQARPGEFGSGRQLVSIGGQQANFGAQQVFPQTSPQLNTGVDRRWESQRRGNMGSG
uniref:Uncharacterized protein n=1 Tax=Parascaris equorum TaxID=6256 RepID=A0A914RT83_PAREQ